MTSIHCANIAKFSEEDKVAPKKAPAKTGYAYCSQNRETVKEGKPRHEGCRDHKGVEAILAVVSPPAPVSDCGGCYMCMHDGVGACRDWCAAVVSPSAPVRDCGGCYMCMHDGVGACRDWWARR